MFVGNGPDSGSGGVRARRSERERESDEGDAMVGEQTVRVVKHGGEAPVGYPPQRWWARPGQLRSAAA